MSKRTGTIFECDKCGWQDWSYDGQLPPDWVEDGGHFCPFCAEHDKQTQQEV